MAFNMALTDCGLFDLGFEGCKFTWSNNRSAPETVSCRLDRVCANTQVRHGFPSAHVSHIKQPRSDHIPIFLQLDKSLAQHPEMRCRPFCFESMWVRRNDCEKIVRKVWEEDSMGDQSYDVIHNGEICRAELLQWSHEINPNRLIDRTQKRMMELKRQIQTEDVRAELAALSIDLEKLFRDQAEY